MTDPKRECCDSTIATQHHEDCSAIRVWCCKTPFNEPHVSGCAYEPRNNAAREEGFKYESWLGRYIDNGWSIQIVPGLSDQDWSRFNARAQETWSDELKDYDPNKALFLLAELFPARKHVLRHPRCGRLMPPNATIKRKHACAEEHSIIVRYHDVSGNRIAVAFCGKHADEAVLMGDQV